MIDINKISIASIFDKIKQILIIYELDGDNSPGRLITINPFGIERLGYSLEDFEDGRLKDLFSDNIYDRIFEDLKDDPEFKDKEYTFLNKEGLFLDVKLNNCIYKLEGNTLGVLIGEDISDKRKLEEEVRFLDDEVVNQKENYEALIDNLTQTQEQLLQTEKMAALGQLIAGVAHEINSPLGAIKASNTNINDSLKKAIEELPRLFSEYSKEEQEAFITIFYLAKRSTAQASSREKRLLKREIKSKLDEIGVDNSTFVADKFIYLGIYSEYEPIFKYATLENFVRVLDSVKDFISILKNTNTISIAVEKAAKVTFALKKFAHQDHSGEMIPTDIVDSIETVLTLYNNQIKHGINIIRKFKKVPLVTCNADEINQVWTNLVQNALHAMGQKGELTISVGVDNEMLVVSVKDTGYGIEPGIGDKIFQPFFTTKKIGEGSGLGLDIVKKIIEKHDGVIYFESEINLGTTFFVKLPLNNKDVSNG